MEIIEKLLKEVPEGNIPMTTTNSPSETITIYNGQFILKEKDLQRLCEGSITFNWLPTFQTRVHFKILEGKSLINEQMNNEQRDVLIDSSLLGKLILLNSINSDSGTTYMGILTGEITWGDRKIQVDKIIFEIPNLKEFIGEGIKTGTNVRKGRITLENDKYIITLDKIFDFNTQYRKLESYGGYIFLYSGMLTKKKGSLNFDEAKTTLECLHWFLSFVNGSRTSAMFIKGVANEQLIWQNYNSRHVDQFKTVWSWSPKFRIDGLKDLWSNFLLINKDPDDFDCLTTSIHWYIEANKGSGYAEGSIMMIQNALELLFNWQVVEKNKIIKGSDSRNITASNKIRLLLFLIKQTHEIPDGLEFLKQIADGKDGPEIIVEIRNAIVHGNEDKRKKLKDISGEALYQSMQLGLLYIELTLLYIMNYKGEYTNRCVTHASVIQTEKF
ncbi:hypothetical protein A4H97_33890 [Niastella yeongjuensis]|uniref:YopA central domain-containing protein n=1 Tax=Niastella yeongjuensis TaxID=354355 RepID=A0A1V9EBU6_9BACT|nr:hypothetical protein [Niastella yeongjuensis]OQP43593.1 hypothetical protein A4H97_33890 [Niastella yeongjuensis]SEP45867.1 hypothetical protein SAMN05660816_06371 [Niastella yeongjuensis]